MCRLVRGLLQGGCLTAARLELVRVGPRFQSHRIPARKQRSDFDFSCLFVLGKVVINKGNVRWKWVANGTAFHALI